MALVKHSQTWLFCQSWRNLTKNWPSCGLRTSLINFPSWSVSSESSGSTPPTTTLGRDWPPSSERYVFRFPEEGGIPLIEDLWWKDNRDQPSGQGPKAYACVININDALRVGAWAGHFASIWKQPRWEEEREAGGTDSQGEFTGGEDPLLLISKNRSCSGREIGLGRNTGFWGAGPGTFYLGW